MLNNISSLITPDLYKAIYEMGHLDELAIVDANQSAQEVSERVIFHQCEENQLLLDEILKYFPLDEDEINPVNVFRPDHVDKEDPFAWSYYQEILDELGSNTHFVLNKLVRKEFNDKVKGAYVTIKTLDKRLYSNIVIRKGVIL